MLSSTRGEDVMLYSFHELQRSLLGPISDLARVAVDLLEDRQGFAPGLVRANCALLHRLGKEYEAPRFDIRSVTAHEREVAVTEEVVARRPFCQLRRFVRRGGDAATTAALARDPRVLVCAPLSGHHPTLLRDTVATLLRDHDVYVTNWLDAREVPTAAGAFHLADYVHYIQDFIRLLGERGPLHVVSVCQPTVPVLAAVSLLASAGEPTPQTLTLMGGPIDARVNPTVVNKLATERPLDWFRSNMVHRVPGGYPGAGREVYPGFLQLTAFVMMNPQRHSEAYRSYWVDQLRGNPTAQHEKFYDEYNAVLDMDAAYYLETVATVFQDFALARGTWVVDGAPVRPADITTTALFTIEGETDDISGLGQTEAAHRLCAGIPEARHRHLVAAQCGHYGLFSGNRWRTSIYPELRGFIAAHQPTKEASR
jgi:poly(3-hydroxybutyrate) depolymerase